jgi:glutathione S-transferase
MEHANRLPTPSDKYLLYGRPGLGSDMPQMLLEEIGAPYELVRVGRSPTDIEAYRRVAGTSKLPALGLPEGGTVFESAAICIYLAETHPQAHLAPPVGTTEHARFLQWMVYLAANVYECCRRIHHSEAYGGPSGAETVRRKAIRDFADVLAPIVASLTPFVLGNDISAADFYLYVLVGWHPDGRETFSGAWPELARHTSLLAERASVRKVGAQPR